MKKYIYINIYILYICVTKLTINGPDNGLSPGRRQAIIWTNAGILLTGLLGTNFSKILIGIYIFIQENAFEIVVRKLAAILSLSQCVNQWWTERIEPLQQAIGSKEW